MRHVIGCGLCSPTHPLYFSVSAYIFKSKKFTVTYTCFYLKSGYYKIVNFKGVSVIFDAIGCDPLIKHQMNTTPLKKNDFKILGFFAKNRVYVTVIFLILSMR